jgi:hypothetical protein
MGNPNMGVRYETEIEAFRLPDEINIAEAG